MNLTNQLNIIRVTDKCVADHAGDRQLDLIRDTPLVFSFEIDFVGICNRKTWRNTNTPIKAGTAQPKIELSGSN
ncbi:hypothetical protein T01_11248 [Trichinella spiralis]|uniref:Uncharacterized protein n=1 Tax=Trichinella spiralis TaxID=6334 RepID=A0A0V1B7J2_TRISP|nr:hypothetical protein T01_11248 [Trichinella spiralis]